MRTLGFPFYCNGYMHELIERKGLVCLVKRSKPEHWHYEVVKLKVFKPEEFKGKMLPEREAYPSSEYWGTNGFTFRSDELNKARERYLYLKKRVSDAPAR